MSRALANRDFRARARVLRRHAGTGLSTSPNTASAFLAVAALAWRILLPDSVPIPTPSTVRAKRQQGHLLRLILVPSHLQVEIHTASWCGRGCTGVCRLLSFVLAPSPPSARVAFAITHRNCGERVPTSLKRGVTYQADQWRVIARE